MTDPHQAAALTTRGVSKTFGAVTVLRDFHIDIAAGEIHALVGENGSGKSTFIKVLSGFQPPDRGAAIFLGGSPVDTDDPTASQRLGARFVHQDLGLVNDLSIADNLGLGMGYPTRFGTVLKRRTKTQAADDLERLGLHLDPATKVADISLAQRSIVSLARALQVHPGHDLVRLLVLDEPTATLPADDVQMLLGVVRRLAGDGVGILYVTHHLGEVFDVAERVTVLRDGATVACEDVAGLSQDHLVELLVGNRVESRLAQQPAAPADQRTVLHVSDLRSDALAGISMDVQAGEVLGIAGITGSGRETVLSTIFGGLPRTAGTVRVGGQVIAAHRPDLSVRAGVGYLPPDRKVLGAAMELSAKENFSITGITTLWQRLHISRKREKHSAQTWFTKLEVRPKGRMEARIGSYSGGNQQKVLLAKWLWRDLRLLLLDEPTQGVDIAAKQVIHDEVLDAARQGLAVIVASTDIDELVRMCSRVVIFRSGAVREELTGDDITPSRILSGILARDAVPGPASTTPSIGALA